MAEFGFFGVVVYTRVQTPRLCGQAFNAGHFVFFFQAEDGIRDAQESRGLGDVYKRQVKNRTQGRSKYGVKKPKAEK